MSLLCSRKRFAFGLTMGIGLFAGAVSAHAQEVEVYANQYVVEYHRTSAAVTASDFSTPESPVHGVQSLGAGTSTALITTKPKTAAFGTAASSGKTIVAYDAALDECVHLLKTGIVSSCSPNYVLKASDTTPNDPQLSALWGLNAAKGINAPAAWDISTGSSDVVVAIIDTGIDYTHPDLAANMWRNPGEIPGNGIDDDRNGYVDDVFGMSAIGRTGNPFDDNGHGTHCAGTIGGVGNNGAGVVGVNWNVKMMGLKFLSATGSGSLSAAIEAINYMVDMKHRGVNIRVSSNSWGGGSYSQSLATAIKRATDAGIVFVAAAGNEANNNDQSPSYPADYDGVVSVAAVDQNRNLASFSNYGVNNVDIAAPGVAIYSTYPNGRYASLSGTSMATPHVAGAMALLLGANAGMNAAQAVQRLYDSGVPLSSLTGVVRTGRMLHLSRLMRNETAPIPAPTPTPPPCGYAAASIPFSSDAAVENAPILIQGDELNFQQVDLPFSFPFSGAEQSAITISPNGLVYVARSPQTMDYQNGDKAPISSIAALHADLIMDGSLGARVLVESNKVSVYWLAEHYSMRGKGQIGVRAVIHQSGTIETFLSFSNAEIQNFMQARATMGVTGPSDAYSRTFAYNNGQIRNGQAVQYTPVCGSNSQPGQALTLKGINVRDSRTGQRKLTPGKAFQVVLSAQGQGSQVVPLNVLLDGKLCQLSSTASITPGKVKIRARLPRTAGYFSKVAITSGALSSQARITSDSRVRSSSRRQVRKARSANFEAACRAVVNAL